MVYAAPVGKIPADLRLTPEQEHERLLFITLPRFTKEVQEFVLTKVDGQTSKLCYMLRLPIVLRAHFSH
ncbi:unnamed protein product [Phytomonas sp. EM1]|nr:unnamed protein product [Phytomonas sp. EM1]|eukprot:CCW59940.1 unnamed protein product [Phytomonas sp. isolate EM1]